MLKRTTNGHWIRLGISLLTSAVVAIPLAFLLPQLGVAAALLFMPLLWLVDKGILSMSAASGPIQGIGSFGISLINFATPIAIGLGVIIGPYVFRALNNLVALFKPSASVECFDKDYGWLKICRDLDLVFADLGRWIFGIGKKRSPDAPDAPYPTEEGASSTVAQTGPHFTPHKAIKQATLSKSLVEATSPQPPSRFRPL